jgi:hypothetical protein
VNRSQLELAAASLLAALAVLTIAVPDWIEAVFHVEPDGGSGLVEVAIVLAFALGAAALWLHRRVHLRRLHADPPLESPRG